MEKGAKTWCDKGEHERFERYVDFNNWIESEEASDIRLANNIDAIKFPSKAFFAGDMEAYDQAFEAYRKEKRHAVLNENYFKDHLDDDHWFERNLDHFDQLVASLALGNVVPFVGAGLSVGGGYPSWKAHLQQQCKTAGLDPDQSYKLLQEGHYEEIIEIIEKKRGPEVFAQEIRDVFSRPGQITYSTRLLVELFHDTVITTNYDRLLESAYEQIEEEKKLEIISGLSLPGKPSADKVTLYKLHGDVGAAGECILSKSQYDQVYGESSLDFSYPLPKMLTYFYRNSSLLFLGCSLNNDRTMQVLREIKKKYKHTELPQHFAIDQAPENKNEFVERNEYLQRLGITGIWFEKGMFDSIEEILQLALYELRYRGLRSAIIDKMPNRPNSDKPSKGYLMTAVSTLIRKIRDMRSKRHY